MTKIEKKQKKLEKLQAKEEQKRERQEKKKKISDFRKNKMTFKANRSIEEDESVIFAPKNTSWKKVVAVLLWVVIAFFTVQGVITVMTRETSDEFLKKVNTRYDEISNSQNILNESGTFVQSFLGEYYHYEGKDDKWTERVTKYLSGVTTLEEPDSNIESEQLLSSQIRSVEINEGRVEVTASVEVYYTSASQIGDEVTEKAGRQRHTVKVLVSTDGTNYAVMAPPMYVADLNRAYKISDVADLPEGDTVSKEELAEVEVTAENFFKAYYGTDSSQLKYYVTKDFGLAKVVGGGIAFDEIDSIQATKVGKKVEAKVRTVVNNGFGNYQEIVFLTMVRGAEDRLYVDKIDIE